MKISRALLAALSALVLAACPGGHPGAPDSGPATDAGPPQVDAGAPPPPDLALIVRETVVDGGVSEVPVEPGSRPLIDPPAELRVTSNLPLRNYRVRVFDEADRVIPSDDQAEDGALKTEYRIRFSQPLKTGHRYALVMDAQSGTTFSDATGRAHPDIRLEFLTSGERERASKKPGKHKRR